MNEYEREGSTQVEVHQPVQLRLTSGNGAVVLSGSDQSDVDVQISVRGRSSSPADITELLQEALKAIRYHDGELSIESPRREQGWSGNIQIDYVIHVPATTSAHLQTANGQVEVGSIEGPLDVRCGNGQVQVRDVQGHVTVEAANGQLRLQDCGGGLDASLANSRVEIQELAGALRLKCLNGPFRYRGAISGDMDVNIMNGSMDFDLPHDARFQLDAETAHGMVESDFNVTDGRPDGDVPNVRLRARNGRIRLRRLIPVT